MSRKWKHCKKNNKDLGKYVEIIWSAWIPSQNSIKTFFFSSVLMLLHILGARQMGFFLCPWMFYQKPRKKEIKNINIENDFFPCVQKFFVINRACKCSWNKTLLLRGKLFMYRYINMISQVWHFSSNQVCSRQ